MALMLVLLQSVGFIHRYPGGVAGNTAAALLWIVASAGFIYLLRRYHDHQIKLSGRLVFSLAILVNTALDAGQYQALKSVGYSNLGLIITIHAIFILLFVFIGEKNPRACIVLAACYTIAALAVKIFSFPLTPCRSDMLIAITNAFEQLFAGTSPYQEQVIASWRTHMPYLPLTFMSFLPSSLLGVDPRWSVLLYRAAWVALTWHLLLRGRTGDAPRRTFVLVLLNPTLNTNHDLYFEVFYLLLVLFFHFTFEYLRREREGKVLPSALLAGLLLTTRQWFWIIFPFTVVLFREVRAKLVRYLAVSLLVALVISLPFVIAFDVEEILATVFKHQHLLVRDAFRGEYSLGFSRIFFLLGIQGATQPIQGLITIVLFGITAFKKPKGIRWEERVLQGMVITLFLFIMLNPLIWNYFYLSPLLLLFLLFTYCNRGDQTPATQ